MKRKLLALGLLLWWFCPLRWVWWCWRELSTSFDNWLDLIRFAGFSLLVSVVLDAVAFVCFAAFGAHEVWLDMLGGHAATMILILLALACNISVREALARADEILTARERRDAQAGDMTMVEDD